MGALSADLLLWRIPLDARLTPSQTDILYYRMGLISLVFPRSMFVAKNLPLTVILALSLLFQYFFPIFFFSCQFDFLKDPKVITEFFFNFS